MKTRNSTFWLIIEQVLPWLVLGILLTYSYAKFFMHSYGFRVSPSSGVIGVVFDRQPEPTLRENDRILQIGSMPWEDFQADLSRPFFEGYKPGQVVPITVERAGQKIDISWTYPAFHWDEFRDQLNSEWWIAYFFWLAGVLTILLVRPRDTSRRLMAIFNFLTAIWLIAGSGLSAYHIWYSAIVLRVAVWLCLPVYLHLHWVFPRPLGKLPLWLVGFIYVIGILFAIAQALQLLPGETYLLAFAFALGGSFVLLLIHIWRQPEVRSAFRLPLVVLLLAIVPAMLWTVIDSWIGVPGSYGGAGLLSLPLLPLAYLYTAFRRRFGTSELRINRFFTVYLFLMLLGIIGLPLIGVAEYNVDIPNKSVVVASLAGLLTTAACLGGYPPFQNFMDYYVLGIPRPSKGLLEVFSAEITTSISLQDLIRVLQEDVFPSLLVREFAFLQYEQGSLNVLSTMVVRPEQLPGEPDIPALLARSGFYRSPSQQEADQPYAWIRLVLSLKLGEQLIGFWLLGRRDPDDMYSQQEIPMLSSLANLTAIALSNIRQTERLTSMYQANINRYEQERASLARDLHDSILNEWAALPIRSDAPIVSSSFQQAYDGVSEQLREIVHGLRPPMLAFGLKLALESYAENLRERNRDSVEIVTNIQADGEYRCPLLVENNLYRIVQEACENALRYAQAKTISITGSLEEKRIQLKVEDDGTGIDPQISLKLEDLAANKHFGLTGMYERASVIGAKIKIASKENEGTHIQVIWTSTESI